jgi:hypothetical protein
MATVFTLEALFAKKGDALLLHYGPWEEPGLVLIDGGPRGVYRKHLRPRLTQLREELNLGDDDSLPIRLVMVSHVDDDHIAGVIDLFNETLKAKAKRKPLPYKIDTLWHNSFDDILGNTEQEIFSRMAATVASNDPSGLLVPNMSRESKAVVVSTAQGRTLRNAANKLGVKTNKPFKGLILAPAEKTITVGHGLSFTIIGPSQERVTDYQERWDKDLKKILAKEDESAKAAAFEDDSPFNLASICVLAQMKGKQMLLTGDARGDFIIEGLEKNGLLKETGSMHIDILKVPHHGSDRNVEDSFFQRITADHYILSGDGEHGNPERKTLEMIRRARGTEEYTIYFTFTEDAHLREKNKKRKAALKKVHDWVKQSPSNCTVVYRDKAKDASSVSVNLLDEL